jgi:hypothetical protein
MNAPIIALVLFFGLYLWRVDYSEKQANFQVALVLVLTSGASALWTIAQAIQRMIK